METRLGCPAVALPLTAACVRLRWPLQEQERSPRRRGTPDGAGSGRATRPGPEPPWPRRALQPAGRQPPLSELTTTWTRATPPKR